MLKQEVHLKETKYTHVNAMVKYWPHWMPPRDPTETHCWQESLLNCTRAARLSGINSLVWEQQSSAASIRAGRAKKGPTLGPLLQCVAARLPRLAGTTRDCWPSTNSNRCQKGTCLRSGTGTRSYLHPN